MNITSLMNKRCFLRGSIYNFEFPEKTIFNLTIKVGSRTYNTIRISPEDEYIYLDDVEYGWIWENTVFLGGDIEIIGGDDVDDPETISFIEYISEFIMHRPNKSPESLDNKTVEFNSTLTKTPSSLWGKYIKGFFNYTTYGSTDHSLAINTIYFGTPEENYIIKFSYRIPIWSEHPDDYDLRLTYKDECWLEWGEPICPPLFVDFKYTGMEEDEDFMNWLYKNAIIKDKKNKDRKNINNSFKKIDLSRYAYKSEWPLTTDQSPFGSGYTDFSTFDIATHLSFPNRIFIEGTYRLDMDEDPIPGFPSTPGTYNFFIDYQFGQYDYEIYFETGLVARRSGGLVIYDFECWDDPDFLEWITDNFYVEQDLKNCVVEFNNYVADINYWIQKDCDAYNGDFYMTVYIDSEKRYFYTPSVYVIEDEQKPNRISSLEFYNVYHDNGLGFKIRCSFSDCRWHYIEYRINFETYDITILKDVILDKGPVFIGFNCYRMTNNELLRNWLYDSANICYAKGINTTEELLENICDIYRRTNYSNDYYSTELAKININDIILNALPHTYESFYIAGEEHHKIAYEGMTWRDWIEKHYPDYNILDLSTLAFVDPYGNGELVTLISGGNVNIDNLINEKGAYTFNTITSGTITQSYDLSFINSKDNATYGFNYSSNVLTPSNKSVDNSFAYAKLTFNMPVDGGTVEMNVTQNSEANYDYGLVSNIDTALVKSYSDITTNVKYSAKGLSGSATITFENVSKGKHFITVKYRKDSSQSTGDDAFNIVSLTGTCNVLTNNN